MKKEYIVDQIRKKKSFLCVGLDTDIKKVPAFLHQYEDPVFEFNRRIINATSQYCVAYKPNIAFYEANGVRGWESLQRTLQIIPDTHFTIADAKRGDIGNTSKLYARTFFETFSFDSVTVAPYMGKDSVTPFLEFEDKWVILLALTSNAGSKDFQFIKDIAGESLYEKVLKTSMNWANADQMMYVVGATQAESLHSIRRIVPDHFLLVPGIGSQGGDLEATFRFGANHEIGLLVNSSRGIIYAGDTEQNFESAAAEAAYSLQRDMQTLMGG
ncbi:MAG: orotidine-5'-phosphate decarboxylase [Saprospiraceae bacterium]|nr:orotidine-5'-phosphate decarboxylase [Saprospiraceae bacterium]